MTLLVEEMFKRTKIFSILNKFSFLKLLHKIKTRRAKRSHSCTGDVSFCLVCSGCLGKPCCTLLYV